MPKEYERIEERAARGQYDLVLPLDYLILEKLPKEGTMGIGDLYPLGTTVRDLHKDFPKLTISQITSRIRALHVQNLVTKVRLIASGAGKGNTSGHAWQVSESGQKLLNNWKDSKNGSGS